MIKTERTQIPFSSKALIAVVLLDLKVPINQFSWELTASLQVKSDVGAVNAMNLHSQYLWNIFFLRRNIQVSWSSLEKTKLYHNRPGDTSNQTNLHLEPHGYWINYVNIDLPHYYGISVCSLGTDVSPGEKSLATRRDGCFHRLVMWTLGSVPGLWCKALRGLDFNLACLKP